MKEQVITIDEEVTYEDVSLITSTFDKSGKVIVDKIEYDRLKRLDEHVKKRIQKLNEKLNKPEYGNFHIAWIFELAGLEKFYK